MAWGVPKLGTSIDDATGNFDLIEPAGVAQGDLMIACIAYRGNAAVSLSGWSAVATAQNSGDTDATNGIASGAMFYVIRDSSAPNLTVTRTGGDVALARIISYSPGSDVPVYDTGSANTLGSASATVTTGTITTALAGELIVAMTSAGDTYNVSAFDAATDPTTASGATDTTTAPTNGTWIERSDVSTATGADGGLAIADAVRATAGATGTIQATVGGSARHVMIAGAFKLGTPPTVTTDATPTLITVSSARYDTNSISSIGSENPTARGLCWVVGSGGTPTTADAKEQDNGSFSVGSFLKTATPLLSNTTYSARAYATNTFGTSYGAVVEVTTLPDPSLTQAAFRFYADGTESGSSALQNQDTNHTADISGGDTNLALRVRLQNNNTNPLATTDDWQLQYSKNGGAYASVTGSSTDVKAFTSSNLTDAGTTTNRLGSGTGSFVAGEIDEADGLVTDRQITASNYSELLYSLTVVAADVAGDDTLDFRVLRNGATTGMTYTVTPRITIESGASTPTINVSDTATITENRSLLIPELFINKSDSVTVTEDVQRLLESYVNNSDTATLTENVLETMVNNLSVSDTATLSENIQLLLESYISKSDTATITEAVTLLITELHINKSDSVTVTELVTKLLESYVNASDTSTVTENRALDIPVNITTSDSSTITGNVKAEPQISVNKSETATITENVSVSIVTDTPDDYTVNVSDNITITEAVQQLLSVAISTSDTATITENVVRLLESYISKSDTATISETVQRMLESYVSSNDTATITENIVREMVSLINVSDTTTITELVQNGGVPNPNVSDTVSITESPSVFIQTGDPMVTDNISVSESVALELSAVLLNVSDSASVSENVKAELNSRVEVSDSTTVSEAVDLEHESFISTSDSVTVTENADPELESYIRVSDTSTISENWVAVLPTLLINKSESITLSESRSVSIEGVVNPRKYYIDSNANIYWVINESLGLVEKI